MANKVKVTPFTFETPVWSVATAKPGDEVELSVTAKDLAAGQKVFFEVRDDGGMLAILEADKTFKKKWVVPTTAGDVKIRFDAVLREVPTPANQHLTVRRRVTSPLLTVQGYKVEIASNDAFFAPKAEKLEVKFKVTDAGGAAKKGRYEIWGERYPSNKPLYTEIFTPAAGDTTWGAWDGKGNDGVLKDKYISPEFSPYRVRVVIGPDEDSVKDPGGKGKGKVAMSEKPFEVQFQSMNVRLQSDLEPAVKTALDHALVIEPRSPKGEFAASCIGRIPLETEPALLINWAPGQAAVGDRPGMGRIRIPNARHIVIGESLNQGTHDITPPPALLRTFIHGVGDAYMDKDDPPPDGGGGAGKTKFQYDKSIYSRPELPIEFELRLKSKVAATNAAPTFGLFVKEAVGAVNVDVLADDVFSETLYAPADAHATYLKKAATKVKRGKHDGPYNDGANPEITYWQERFKIAADGDRDITTEEAYVMGSKELTVYLNRAKLQLDAKLDYVEVTTKKIQLKAGLTKAGDIVWVTRVPSAAHGTDIKNWAAYPPGDNAHDHYGGVRGAAANPNLRDDFSGAGAGSEHILGKGKKAFPYASHVRLDPDKPDKKKETKERVEAQALTSGAHEGLAGVIFTPSAAAGDSYRIEATLHAAPYARTLGFVENRDPALVKDTGAIKPLLTARTGTMTVWRFCSIRASSKLPNAGTPGLSPGVGFADAAIAARVHPGDGLSMNVAALNTQSAPACIEWEVPVPAAAPVAGEPHQDVKLADYRTSHNGQAAAQGKGHFNLTSNAMISNEFVQWDHFRVMLPPNTPLNRRKLISNTIGGIPKGTVTATNLIVTVQTAINTYEAAINPGTGAPWGIARPDQALAAGVSGIPIADPALGWTPALYDNWIVGEIMKFGNTHLDKLTPRINPPKAMSVVRWPIFYQDAWDDGTPGAMAVTTPPVSGYCRGSGQSFFCTNPGIANVDTFEHEMGHSLHLVHFSTGRSGNSAWKHHDNGYRSCKMGYNNKAYTVPLPVGVLGGAIAINTGARDRFCAKCQLKMRGWKELELPCNWTHPSVF